MVEYVTCYVAVHVSGVNNSAFFWPRHWS